jgi:hypothetical protein
VVLDFSSCTDFVLSTDVVASDLHLDCARKTVWGTADVTGTVRFVVVGSGINGASEAAPACVRAYADGISLRAPITTAFDLDGVNGVNARDLSIAAADFYSGVYHARCDYDGDGAVTALDLCRMARVFYAGGSITSGGANCGP